MKAFILSDWMFFFSYSFRNLTITKQMYFPWNIWTQQGLCQTSAEKLGKSSVYCIVVAIGRSKWSFALSLMRFSHDMVCWKHSLGAKNCCHKTICWFRIAIVFHLTDEAKKRHQLKFYFSSLAIQSVVRFVVYVRYSLVWLCFNEMR